MPDAHSYGKKIAGSDHVVDTFKAPHMIGIAGKFNEIKEAKYASNIREPLFKGFERQYQWPEHVANKENYPFGVATISSDSVKEIVNPEKPLVNPPEIE